MAVGGCSFTKPESDDGSTLTQPRVQLTSKQLQESHQAPYEQTYYRESPEIDLCKRMIDAYLNGNWDVYQDFYADTARIRRNKSEMTPQQLIAYHQKALESVSAYSMDPPIWEMIVTDKEQQRQ